MAKTARNPLERPVSLERLQMAMVGGVEEEDGALQVLDEDKASKEEDRVSKETFLASSKGGGERKMEKDKKKGEEETLLGCRRKDGEMLEGREERLALWRREVGNLTRKTFDLGDVVEDAAQTLMGVEDAALLLGFNCSFCFYFFAALFHSYIYIYIKIVLIFFFFLAF